MKILRLVFLFLFYLVISSCKKLGTETTSVKVTHIDNNTQKGVPNIKVILYEGKHLVSANYDTKVLNEIYTDANGQADFGEFETHRNDKYFYGVERIDPDNTNIKKGEINNLIFSGSFSITLTLKFILPPPYNPSDSLSVTFINANNIHYNVTNNNYANPQLMYLPSGYEYINIDKYKSGVYTNIKDTVFYPANSINEYDVYW
ncbi:MAG: hypothetical protein A3F72_15120 [Bacteroidetes bacterium RIFCSPLOWO2_12_FULL_35_15]|nr:MAG: hypothetical protein A3F72_15120 [Bacteroidetes bacterium RIFCSPLOWO2_12_FULL_35_15]